VINDVALEQRALEGARAAGSAPPRSGVSGPASEPPARTRPTVAPASDPAPAKKPTPAPPTIELIEGAKRSQIQIVP